jgi:rhamnose transport system ATP-binding protein
MVREMVGRAIDSFAVKTAANPVGEVALSVHNLGRAGVFRGVTFDLAKGEVLCLAGLVGARRTDVGLALFGIAPATEGRISLHGQDLQILSPRRAMDLGIAYVSEDRRKLGLAHGPADLRQYLARLFAQTA